MNQLLNQLGETKKLLDKVDLIIEEIGNENRCKKLKIKKAELIEELKNIDTRVFKELIQVKTYKNCPVFVRFVSLNLPIFYLLT